MKKTISLILSLLMLVGMFTIQASAADVIIHPEVLNSVTEEEETGLGLAFRYTMNMTNVTIWEGTNRTFKGATVTLNGVEYDVVKMGAIVTNNEATGKDINAMVIENTNNGEGSKIKDVEATKLWDWDDTTCSFAVRVTNIPTTANKANIYARPYYIYKDANNNNQIVYDDVDDNSYFRAYPVELPAIGSDIDVTKKKNRIRVSDAYQTVTEEGNRQVTLTFRNYTSNWITEETDYVKYTCYDANGDALETKTIYIGCIDTKKNKVKSFTFEVPDATAKVALTYSKIVYWTEWS